MNSTGTCTYPVLTDGGNGPPITTEIVAELGACFEKNYGSGVNWVIDGIDIPDFGGQGNAWGVGITVDGVSCIIIIISSIKCVTNLMLHLSQILTGILSRTVS